jgi:ParB family chromosome partitioning protein
VPLGKSLNTILGDYFGPQEETYGVRVQDIPLNQITISEFQTRTRFPPEKIEKLASNIRVQGLIHPIVVLQKRVTTSPTPEYILLAGERRLKAIKKLEWESIPAVVKTEEELNPAQQALVTATENLQREDLSPVELAQTFRMLMQTQNIDENELAKVVGYSPQYIKNYVRLLSLSEPVRNALLEKKLTEGQARPLVSLSEDLQQQILTEILEKELTVKEIRHTVDRLKAKEAQSQQPSKRQVKSSFEHSRASEIRDRVEKITQFLPENAKIKMQGSDEEGKIVIQWKPNQK